MKRGTGSCLYLLQIVDRMLKEAESVGLPVSGQSRPERVIRQVDVALGVGHQAQDPARLVGQAGDVVFAAVGVDGVRARFSVRIDVAQGDAPLRFQLGKRGGVARHDLSLGMRDGRVQPGRGVKKRAVIGLDLQVHPTVLEAGRVVERDGDGRFAGVGLEQAAFGQDLKSVADAEHEMAAVNEPPQHVAEMMAELVGQDLAGRDVVAVGEPTGNREHLIVVERRRPLEQPGDVKTIGSGAHQLPGTDRLEIAVGPGGTKNEYTDGHITLPSQGRLPGLTKGIDGDARVAAFLTADKDELRNVTRLRRADANRRYVAEFLS